MVDVQPQHQLYLNNGPAIIDGTETEISPKHVRLSSSALDNGIVVPEFSDFSSYTAPPARPQVSSTASAPSVIGLQPAAPIVSTTTTTATAIPSLSPQQSRATGFSVSSSIPTSNESRTSTSISTSPSLPILPITRLAASPSSSSFSVAAPQKTSPIRLRAGDTTQNSLSGRPQLPRSFSLGGSAARRNQQLQGSALFSLAPQFQAQQALKAHEGNKFITPAEYALHIVFTQFVRHAEKKLNLCLSYSLENEPPITTLLGVGADPVFDKILKSLGYISRQRPRPVIDAVMFWRKSKSEAATAAARDKVSLPPHQNQPVQSSSLGLRHKVSKSLSDRSPIGHRHQLSRQIGTPTVNSGSSFGFHKNHSTSTGTAPQSAFRADLAQQADRKSLISIYILCRVLIEVVKQTSADMLGEEMGDKLEEIVFKQIKASDSSLLNSSVIRSANWNLFAELLGEMSKLRFISVSDRFIAELEKTNGDVNMSKEQEINVQLIIHGMKYLKLTVYPMDAFEDSADFMESVSKFLVLSHGQRIKQAYCEVMNQLLLNVAGTATAEVNYPTWVSAISMSYPKVLSMVSKQKYWASAFPLACTLLCVAPSEIFKESWVPLLEANYNKLKDRNCRVIVICGIARLLWVYLRRCTESLNNATKRLDQITKTLFLGGQKKSWLTADPGVIGACIQLIRFVGASHPEYCLKNILFPLLSSDTLNATTELNLSIDLLSSERMIVGISSFLAILSDAQSGNFPPFYAIPKSNQPLMSDDFSLPNDPIPIPTNPLLKEYYHQFTRILGRIAVICDNYFGGQTVLDEKLSGSTPKTPSGTFSFRDKIDSSSQSSTESLYANYELILTVFEAIPRCVPSSVAFGKIVEMLCKGTMHPDERVARAAVNALKSLARNPRYSPQTIVTGFARFIFNFEERYSTTADMGLLDATFNVENTLKFYVELLNIWVDVIKKKTIDQREILLSEGTVSPITTETSSSSRGEEMETASVWSVIEEIESNGLFFLCSQSRAVRRYAVSILRLIKHFDAALDEQVEVLKMQSKNESRNNLLRIIDVLESGNGWGILDLNSNEFDLVSTVEKSRLTALQQESKDGSTRGILLRLIESESGVDSALWLRAFPRFLTTCLTSFPMPVALCRTSVCSRLLHMQRTVMEIADAYHRLPSHHSIESYPKHSMRTKPEVFLEQWKLYLIVACCTMTATDGQDEVVSGRTAQKNHSQLKLKTPPPLLTTNRRITSAKSLFNLVIPLLHVDYGLVREAVISGLGCININIYKSLLESLQPMISVLSDNRRSSASNANNNSNNINNNNQPPSTSALPWRRNRRHDWLRVEIVHVLLLTSHYLKEEKIYKDTWILDQQVSFIKNTKNFLTQADVQVDWDCQKLRRYFCGLMQAVYESILLTKEPKRWLPFEARVSCFKLIEEWCGYGQNSYIAIERNLKMKKAALDYYNKDVSEQGVVLASMEVERGLLETAAMSSMASILNGPLTETIESHGAQTAVMSFDIHSLFAWTHAIFNSDSPKLHAIGKQATVNLLMANQDHKLLLDKAIAFCYAEEPGASFTQTYFNAVADVLIQNPHYPCNIRQPFALGLFKISDEKSEIRVKAAALLKAMELRFFAKSHVQNYEISISDRTTAVYKRAQFNLSTQFALEYSGLTYPIISELTMFFNIVSVSCRRDILAILIPWLSAVELQLDPNGRDPSPSAYMVMTNLFEITVRFSSKIQNEIEALWVTLASARHHGNVRAILDFLINTSVERRDSTFVEYGKQIVVYIASTPAGAKLVEALIAYIQPTSMLPTHGDPREYPNIEEQFPYVADLSQSLPYSSKQVGFSIGQLAVILLVDLLVSPVAAMSENLAQLLHVVFILLDHYNPLVHEQARELLVHLIHELVLPLHPEIDSESYVSTAEFIDLVRRRDSKTIWSYDDLYTDEESMRTPKTMDFMIKKVLEMFTALDANLHNEWSRIALTWATTCPVRHFACRSFQIFRLTFKDIDQNLLADMLVRLSNTIADANGDIQNFAMQILMTLNAIVIRIESLELMNYPQIFWATVACLQTIHEQEFIETLFILENLMMKFSFDDRDVISLFMSVFPAKWDGKFEGLQKAVLPGLRSSKSYDQTLRVLDKLNALELNEITGDNTRLLYAILVNLARFLHALEIGELSSEIIQAAEKLAAIATQEQVSIIARMMSSLAKGRFRIKDDFIRQLVHAIQATMFTDNEPNIMVFLLGLLSNKIDYVRVETMEILRYLFPIVDMSRPEFVAIGADLISPLLRLLQTEYAKLALQVLDEATYIPGAQMDRHVLRTSLGGRSMIGRKDDFESSTSTFGIPAIDGWSVPLPSVRSSVTRSNVHAVFYSCDVANSDYRSIEPSMNVQFTRDEYAHTGLRFPGQYQQGSTNSQFGPGVNDGGYFGGAFGISATSSSGIKSSTNFYPLERSDTMFSYTGTEDNDGLSHMVAALDNLNSFFAEEPTAYTSLLE
ncbi:cell morphogenesis N-terminal-domain-containing protein [Lipomyces japonicus]|uniref:cell morphogenesis N-terminal-domain-containing protein n=1 Tax=Lipomyces japonicus TaxID=56871 RepID=UPI0034D00D03